jgi:hypothetical protein
MNFARFFFVTAISLVIASHAADDIVGWQSLFDGKTLNGWKTTAKSQHSKASGFKTAGTWVVTDGVITGNQDTEGNGGLLITEAQYGDCEVSLETKNDFGPDSGLFLRCTEEGKAYQCLIDYYEGGTVGGILGEGIWKKRGLRNYSFGATPDVIAHNDNTQNPCPVKPEAWGQLWRVGEWNEVKARITQNPPTITTWINGVQIMQHKEPEVLHPAEGHIGLQVHGGVKWKGTVRYRNLRIRSL